MKAKKRTQNTHFMCELLQLQIIHCSYPSYDINTVDVVYCVFCTHWWL